jgi:hypothetical protein
MPGKKPTDESKRVREMLIILLEEHRREGTIPTSHRFLFYELVARSIITKHREGKGRADALSNRILTELREEGVIPWEWIADETRSLKDLSGWDDVGRGWLVYLKIVKLNPWKPRRPPLILTESRSLAGALYNLAREYRVLLAATNGQCGGFLHTDIAPVLRPRQRVLYLGDYDLAGNDIEYNTYKVLEKIVGPLEWERIVLTGQQVQAYQLPVIDKTDGRFLFGAGDHGAVETEALSQRVITDIVRDALERHLPQPLADVQAQEEAQRRAFKADLLAANPSLTEEEKNEIEEPELPEAIVKTTEERESEHWWRQAEGKCRRAFSKAGKQQATKSEISKFLFQLTDLGVPVLERTSSRIARAVKGVVTLESLRD